MPFIKADRRPIIDANFANIQQAGDLAYVFYKEYRRRWKAEPRWTTAHNIYTEFVLDPDMNQLVQDVHSRAICYGYSDILAGAQLAWQQFYLDVVSEYEAERRAENGDVE